MRIKNFTFMLLAVLFSTVGFAQKSFPVRNDVAFDRQTTVKTLVRQNSSDAYAVNQQNTTSSSRANKARAKAQEVVTPPEKGDVEYYTLTGKAVYYTSSGSKTVDVSRTVKIVWDDEDEDVVYIQGLSYYLPTAFVKGVFNKEGDKVIIESGQYMGKIQGYDIYFVALDAKTNETKNAEVAFDEKQSTFTFSDYLLDNNEPKGEADFARFLPGVTIVPLEGEPEIPVEIPKDLEIEKYAYTATDLFLYWDGKDSDVSGNLNVGFYGDEVYIQGMSIDYPEAWIKGRFKDKTTVVFPSGQLLTDERSLYFIAVNSDYDVVDNYTLIYDPETGSFEEEGSDAAMINSYKDKIESSVWQFYVDYIIKPITEQPATPAKSVISTIKYDVTGDDILQFILAKVDTDGEGLIGDKLFYKLWYATEDGTEATYTFTPAVYTGLDEETDEIPATFTDGKSFKDGALSLLMDDRTSWISIGISTVYYGGEERHESEIAWYTPVWPQTITLPEGLTVTEHTFKATTTKGGIIEKTVGLAIDGDDIYVRGIGETDADAWVKGTKNSGDTFYTFASGQEIGNYYGEDRLFFLGYTEEGGFVDPILNVNTADGVYEFTTEIVENADYTDKSYYVTWLAVGATISIAEEQEEVPTLVEVPEGLETEAWSFSAEDYFEDNAPVSGNLNIGFDGEDVYVQGLSKVLPSAWVKGLVEDGQITFPYGQYLGVYNGNNVWFLGWNNSNRNVFDYVMEYDAENGVMTNPSKEECIGINTIKNRISASLYESYCNVKIRKIVEKEATPATPSVDHMAFSAYGDFIEFTIPTVDVDGDGLVTDKLSYKLYYDEGDGEAKEVTFVADPELYKYLTEDMTVIPYGFLDGLDEEDGSTFGYDFDMGKVYLNMEHDTWTRVGIQSIYTGGGETNASEIGWYTITWPQEIELPEGAEVTTYAFEGQYSTNNGNVDFSRTVDVAKVEDDVYIQRVGTRSDKTWIKGTRNAETGVYTFPKGQYLGLYVNSDQTDYSNLYLMGYSDMIGGAVDVKMTYDEENDIFTTTTDMIENADYVDKLYYLNYITAGAVIKPLPDVAATPVAPSIDHIAFTPYGDRAEFTITLEDVDGNAIQPSKLFYKLYYDEGDGEAKEVTFTTDDYENLKENMTVIPYGFLDDEDEEGNPTGYDFYASSVYLNMEHSTWTRVGIQSIYTGGDETNVSEIAWYTPTFPFLASLPEGAGTFSYVFTGTDFKSKEEFTMPVNVAFYGENVYIQGISSLDTETWIVGTKNANTGEYVFANGQYLGLYMEGSEEEGYDYSYSYLMGFVDGVGVTDLTMTFDEETGIFTTSSYLVQNADYTDRLYYLSVTNPEATLVPADDEVAISRIDADVMESAARYNIAGQRVGKNYKGIVVEKGRKYLQK
jgi:hypothetical protein